MASKKRVPNTTAAGRFARGRRFDRNPVRRATDRAETVVLVMLVVVFLVGAPLAALGSSAWAHSLAERDAQAQMASRNQVTAVTVAEPVPANGSGALDPEAKARWTAPNGKVMTADLPVPEGTKPGTPVQVWTTSDGKVTTQPMNESGVATLAIVGGVAGVVAVAVLLTLAGALASRSIDRRRMAAWDADWQSTGPRWTTRA